MRIGILGGTGPAGAGVGIRAAMAGHEVMVGSRSPERAEEVALRLDHENITSGDNHAAACFGDVVVLSVPWAAALHTAVDVEGSIRGKVLLSMANAVAFIDGKPESIVPSSGSIALGIQARLPMIRVAAALHHVPARTLCDVSSTLDFDVFACSDDEGALDRVMELISSIEGLRPINAGALQNASAIEALTPLLIGLNIRYKTLTGIRVMGI